MIDFLKAVLLGILEGITEWLPVSSTGHLLLLDEYLRLPLSDSFREIFLYVIQLGAVMAVAVLYGKKILPFRKKEKGEPLFAVFKKDVSLLWGKIALACVPGTVAALLFGEAVDRHLEKPDSIAVALIVYGIAFLWAEPLRQKRGVRVENVFQIGWKDALFIGFFQVLSIVPGTSRSGATILGALLFGVSRTAAAEFTFFMAIPVMAGMSLIKIAENGLSFSVFEWLLLGAGTLSAFLTSLGAIRFLLSFVKKHSFAAFGVYRVFLGAAVLFYFR